MISQIRTIPAALFTAGFAARFAASCRRQRGSGFLARLLTEGAAQEPAAEKKNESREEDNHEKKTKRMQTPAGHKLKHPLLRYRNAAPK
jgi:hypothetical protein